MSLDREVVWQYAGWRGRCQAAGASQL